MIVLIADQANKIGMKVTSSIDISGFSAELAFAGKVYTIPDITLDDINVVIPAADIEQISDEGAYGTLLVKDADGNTYMMFLPFFRKVAADSKISAVGNQTIYIAIASTRDSSGGGGGSPSGDYATHEEVADAIRTSKNYTDEQIEDIGETIVETQPVHVVDARGQPIEMTVQQATQSVVDMQTDIEEGKTTHAIASVKDEDHDGQPDNGVLYLNPSKPS